MLAEVGEPVSREGRFPDFCSDTQRIMANSDYSAVAVSHSQSAEWIPSLPLNHGKSAAETDETVTLSDRNLHVKASQEKASLFFSPTSSPSKLIQVFGIQHTKKKGWTELVLRINRTKNKTRGKSLTQQNTCTTDNTCSF